jgi:2-polyprenyl-6-methoxyphenol hydroxylase-like FAD-dependent oxidoreductase
MASEQVPVLIVGAGGGGLSLSLLLLQQGIHPVVVERRPDSSWYPRARNLNFRTMEVFRCLGRSDKIHVARAITGRLGSVNRRPSMPRRLQCAETWAGNERTASLVELPGLAAWVHSVPADAVKLAAMSTTSRSAPVVSSLVSRLPM